MHDVDRTLREFEGEAEYESHELEGEGEYNEQFLGSVLGSLLGGEMEVQEQEFVGEGEMNAESYEQGFLGEGELQEAQEYGEQERVFDEVQEMELAAELLEVSNEAELEYFLGKLISSAGKVLAPVGKALAPVLKNVARVALPVAGSALGNMVLPGVGGAIGGKLASAAGNLFGLELEGLSPQDQEFEVARRIVRLSGAAAKRAARIPPNAPVRQAVRRAIVSAARRHAPGLLQPRGRQGRFVRSRGAARRQVNATNGARRQAAGVWAPVADAWGRPAAVPMSRPTARPQRPMSPVSGGGYAGGYFTPSMATPSYVAQPAYTAEPLVDGDHGLYGGYVSGYGYGQSTGATGFARSGHWYRRGRKIVLVGV